MSDIQFIHLWQKPLACRTLSNPSQFTVSKAFAKSSFSTTVGLFGLWQTCTNSRAYMKVSIMDLPFIKPV